MKVLMILVDGMRPDALVNCELAQKYICKGAYTPCAKTVFPSVTLPCHMSLFHSVEPMRHGTTTNVYAPQVRPINGLMDVLKQHKKFNAFYYTWPQLRDLARPGSVDLSMLFNIDYFWPPQNSDDMSMEATMQGLQQHAPDFVFSYLGSPDSMGHLHGFMSPEYLQAVEACWLRIDRIMQVVPEDYTVFVLADHGGHDRLHGLDVPEDMTIPVLAIGEAFEPGSSLPEISIIDLAPTVTQLLGVEADSDWEGTSILK